MYQGVETTELQTQPTTSEQIDVSRLTRIRRYASAILDRALRNDDFTVDESLTDRDYFAPEFTSLADNNFTSALGLRTLAEVAVETLHETTHYSNEYERTYKPVIEMAVATHTEKKISGDSHIHGDAYAAVCDSVGSSEDNGMASKLAVRYLELKLPSVSEQPNREMAVERLGKILNKADKVIRKQQKKTGIKMESTVSSVNYITEGEQTYAIIGNIGDSPVYLVRDGEVKEMTTWHGHKFPKPAFRPALGKPIKPTPNIYTIPVEPGDIILPTSNGIRKNDESMERIEEIVSQHHNPDKIARRLVNLSGKSHDDRTVIVSKFKRLTIADMVHEPDYELATA